VDDPAPAGQSKAVGRPATASTTHVGGFAPGLATDGTTSTRWSSEFRDNQWWQVDLGRTRLVNGVRLRWEHAYASRYRILTSTDGQSFQTAAEVTLGAAIAKSTTFPVRDARYVRVQALERATQYGVSLWEGEVYGPPDLVATPPAPPLASPPATGGGTKPAPTPKRRPRATTAGGILTLAVERRRPHARAVHVSGRAAVTRGAVRLMLQRHSGGRWRNVAAASARLRAGRFARSFRALRPGRYRVRAAAHRHLAAPVYRAFRL
jgi:hypothetical protein